MNSMNQQPSNAMELLSQIIEQHISSVVELLEILKQERQALITGTPETISQVSTSKLESVNTFKLLNDKLTDCLGGETIEQKLSRIGSGMNLQQRWEHLMILIKECQKNNLENGGLLDERQSYVRNAIKSLFGHEASSSVYGRAGDTPFRPERRVIASA